MNIGTLPPLLAEDNSYMEAKLFKAVFVSGGCGSLCCIYMTKQQQHFSKRGLDARMRKICNLHVTQLKSYQRKESQLKGHLDQTDLTQQVCLSGFVFIIK